MHTGNQPPFAGGLAQQDLPGTPGLFRIDVEGDRGVLSGKVDEPLTAALPAFFTFAASFGGDPRVT